MLKVCKKNIYRRLIEHRRTNDKLKYKIMSEPIDFP